MEIIPAIDLRNGKCVRLYQGDYSKETVFSEDPVSMALRWKSAGATRLHLVDLDGAAEGKLCNAAIIEEIVSQTQIPVQVGGGIRQIETIEQLLSLGVKRVILGTAAIEDPDLIKNACRKFADSVIVSIDVKDGFARGRGWKEEGSVTIGELIRQMESMGVKRFIYTDIARDGTLTEPNFKGIAEVKALTHASVIAAGGISSIDHLRKLASLSVEGAIIGRAIYTGNIDLKEAIAVIGKLPQKAGSVTAKMPKFDEKGLIPAIIQDVNTGQVLMLGYMNQESLQKTGKSGKVCFWSRSRQQLWTKGETSGNFLNVKNIFIDCDEDAILIHADPVGPTCHTGNQSCFYRKLEEA